MTVSAFSRLGANMCFLGAGVQLESRENGSDHLLGAELLLQMRQRGRNNGSRRTNELQFLGL